MKILDDFVQKVSINQAEILDRQVRLILKDKPEWMPFFLYKFLVKILFEIEYTI